MGFFFNESKVKKRKGDTSLLTESYVKNYTVERLNKDGCKSCPLDKDERRLCSPKMAATGSERPDIYIIGTLPDDTEDQEGEQFVSDVNKLVRDKLSGDFSYRFNNVIRCSPEKDRAPSFEEIESCRGYIEADILNYSDQYIFGFGDIACQWAIGSKYQMNNLRLNKIPVTIKEKDFWFFPFYHPSYIKDSSKNKYGYTDKSNDLSGIFEIDILSACKEISDGLRPPKVYKDNYSAGVEVIYDLDLLERRLNELSQYPYIAIDLETTSLKPYNADSKIISCSVGTFDDSIAFPFFYPDIYDDDHYQKVTSLLGEFLMNSGKKIAHSLSFELEWLSFHYGFENMMLLDWEDTMAQAYSMDIRPKNLGLGIRTLFYYGFDIKDKSSVSSKNILASTLPDILKYNGMDVKWTFKLFFDQENDVLKNESSKLEYKRQLTDAIPAAVGCQLEGLHVDLNIAEELEEKYLDKSKQTEKKILKSKWVKLYEKQLSKKFNPNSPDDVIVLLRDIAGRSEGKRGKKYSSDEKVLKSLVEQGFTFAQDLLDYRGAKKVLSTYIEPVLKKTYVYEDGRFHTQFTTMFVATGRLSSLDPNIQNWPTRKNKDVRSIVCVPNSNYNLVAFDYGGIEARCIAIASKDKKLTDAFIHGYDIHLDWCQRIEKEYPPIRDRIADLYNEHEDEDKITKFIRYHAKNQWVFTLLFGSNYKVCSKNLMIPEDSGEYLEKLFWQEFYGVKAWQERMFSFYKQYGYVTVLGGRKRQGPFDGNEVINTPIQGTASDIVLKAMRLITIDSIVLEKPQYRPIMNIHDDLEFYLPKISLEQDIHHIAETMATVDLPYITLPMVVEVSIGKNWYEMEEIATFSAEDF